MNEVNVCPLFHYDYYLYELPSASSNLPFFIPFYDAPFITFLGWDSTQLTARIRETATAKSYKELRRVVDFNGNNSMRTSHTYAHLRIHGVVTLTGWVGW